MIHRTIWIGREMISPQRRAIKTATGRLISGEQKKKKSGIHKAQDRCLSRNLLYEHGRVYSPTPPHRRRTRVFTGILVGWKNGRVFECLQESAFSPCPSESRRKKKKCGEVVPVGEKTSTKKEGQRVPLNFSTRGTRKKEKPRLVFKKKVTLVRS